LFPYTTLFRSGPGAGQAVADDDDPGPALVDLEQRGCEQAGQEAAVAGSPAAAAERAWASAKAWAATSTSSVISSSENPARRRNFLARWMGFSSSSPRKPPKLKRWSTARWKSRAAFWRSGSLAVRRRSQSEPIFT